MEVPKDVAKYLERIDYRGPQTVDEETLVNIHRQHVKSVPFENLDIHYRSLFDLHLQRVFHKVIELKRGGFCYELNLLFNELLVHLGFDSRIISARIFKDDGTWGPEFDHMAVCVRLDKDHLIDVGFGDLFVTPLIINESQAQSDGRRKFVIKHCGEDVFELSMYTQKGTAVKKYQFALSPVSVEAFEEPCRDKQVNPESYFVRNTICTRATEEGRVTIFNDRLIEKGGNNCVETVIQSDEELRGQLWRKFGIVV